ncbi:hypothetical protein NLI96_g6980 [Meripilus lineatus]|uniref:Uncharacterized protein n=1 Tax=Meripilus lineatus TaxID=2056292 RepID=A0AAD5V4S5_9APHY|nr:hypothetical protein NLI96_g6980 [Physisporinus lineatus]
MKEAHHNRSQSSLPLLPVADNSPPPSPLCPPRLKSRSTVLELLPCRRRFLVLTCASLSFVSLVALSLLTVSRSYSPFALSDVATVVPSPSAAPSPNATVPEPVVDAVVEVPHSPYLLGPPTASFRDNLRNDTKYITSWISAGWNNDVMTYANLIYLGKITDRIPVVGIFTPSHIGGDVPPIAFSEVFDVPRFIKDSGINMVEWDEVKDPDSEVLDDLGCWNIWETVQYYEHFPRGSPIPDWVGLDLSYTRAPDWMKLIPNYEHDKCSTFWALARLAYPEDRQRALGTPTTSPQHHAVLDPDEHMVCYDYLYYACAQQSGEWESEYAPQWREVAKHMRWHPDLERIAGLYVNRVFDLPDDAEVPPYITVHARHGDFGDWCWQAEKPEDCFAPLSAVELRVREVQEEIRQKKGIDIPMSRVIMTSDEKNQTWWDDVKARGWVRMDHEALRTVERYGRWYPLILDSVIQSSGHGFVGTDLSTFSILSKRRVLDWHNGSARMVRWGFKEADAHRKRMLLESE